MPLQGAQIPCRALKSLQTADIAVGSDAEGKALFDLLRQNKWVDLCLNQRSRRNPRSRWIHVQWREEWRGRFVEEYWGDKQREWYRSWHKACRWVRKKWVCQNEMMGEKTQPRSPLLLGGGVRGGEARVRSDEGSAATGEERNTVITY